MARKLEIVRLSRDKAPEVKGVNRKERSRKVHKNNDYATENILRGKYNNRAKTDVHCPKGTSFYFMSDDDWNKIFRKKGEKECQKK